jgi:hypothetical protein
MSQSANLKMGLAVANTMRVVRSRTVFSTARLFVSSSSSEGGDGAKKTRRTKPKPLVRTKREELRVAPELSSAASLSATEETVRQVQKGAQQVSVLALESVEQVQSKVQEYLNPTKTRLKNRVGPNMNARWWRWNIAFHLLPATLIALYCEFVAREEMEEYNREQHAREKAKLVGNNTNPSGIKLPPPPLPRPEDTLVDRIKEAATHLLFGVPVVTDPDPDILENDPSIPIKKSPALEPQNGKHSEGGTGMRPSSKSSQNNEEEANYTANKEGMPMDSHGVQELLRRIKALEQKIEKQEESKFQNDYHRVQQTPMRNRVEDKMMNRWKQEDLDGESDNNPKQTSFMKQTWSKLNDAVGWNEEESNPKESSKDSNNKQTTSPSLLVNSKVGDVSPRTSDLSTKEVVQATLKTAEQHNETVVNDARLQDPVRQAPSNVGRDEKSLPSSWWGALRHRSASLFVKRNDASSDIGEKEGRNEPKQDKG